MPPLDATVGGASANSYVTVDEATAWLRTRLYTETWDLTDATSQAQALMWATALLDAQVVWWGSPTTLTQALAWPQTGQHDLFGRLVPATVLPDFLQRATAIYALLLLEDTSQAVGTVDTGTIKSRKVGDMQITYHDPQQAASETRPVSDGIPAEVRALLRPYAQMSGSMTVRLLRT